MSVEGIGVPLSQQSQSSIASRSAEPQLVAQFDAVADFFGRVNHKFERTVEFSVNGLRHNVGLPSIRSKGGSKFDQQIRLIENKDYTPADNIATLRAESVKHAGGEPLGFLDYSAGENPSPHKQYFSNLVAEQKAGHIWMKFSGSDGIPHEMSLSKYVGQLVQNGLLHTSLDGGSAGKIMLPYLPGKVVDNIKAIENQYGVEILMRDLLNKPISF